MKYLPPSIILLALLLLAPPAFSQATRTWVSGVGDDANPCSRTAPGKTYAGAISKTAAGGEIDNLDEGGFGAVTITKSITIDGGPGVASTLAAGVNGININSGSGPLEVTLRNLVITGQNSGLGGVVITGANPVILHVENCRIFGFTHHGVDFEPGGASALYVKNSHIYSNAGDGIYLKPGAVSVISIVDSVIDDNAVGVHGDANTTTVVDDSKSTGNTGAGFETAAGGAMTLSGCESSLNGTGIISSGTGALAIAGNTITGNGVGLTTGTGGKIATFRNNPLGENLAKKEPTPSPDLPMR